MRLELFTADVPGLFSFLETVLQDGGKRLYSIEGDIKTFTNAFGYSGYEYHEEAMTASLSLGMILGGTGYVLKRTLKGADEEIERFDYYNPQGELTFSSDSESLKVCIVDFYEMDMTCPILNHLYNFLSMEYKKAKEASSATELVYSVEKFLRTVYDSKIIRLPIRDKGDDPAVTNVFNRILKAEMDPVLTWEERQLVFAKHRDTLQKIVETKVRAHRLNYTAFMTSVNRKRAGNFMARVIARPGNNGAGLLHKYTVGKVIWFFQTVKDNLGYSIALAVYGPFTYYFITMPMNPHAMQAVGRVRAAFLDTQAQIVHFIEDKGNTVVKEVSGQTKEAEAASKAAVTQSVSSSAAAPLKPMVNDNIIYQSEVTNGTYTGKNKPSILNMVLSTDVPAVNTASWSDRMSNMKQMQIAYEENIEFASRMGRLEQLETQYNFPMQVESTWEELERYNNAIFKFRTENPNISAKMKQYLFNEVNRTQQLELYLWDRLARFILDQKYVMLDEDKEQKRNDYYVGRSFVFLQEMTQTLSWRYKDFKKPVGFEKIQKLADFYTTNRKELGSVLKNLAVNSDLFKQKNVYDTKEFRGYMKRQWEILYLQNAKAEEAANMGLNMYIWSVRNTVWILQSMYSAKREELALLIKRDTTGQLFSPEEMMARSRSSMLYETLYHNLTLEYVGIREEIMNRLGKDIESEQRMSVINNLKEFLTDREKLDGTHVAGNQKTAGNQL
ncbi:MAG: hypothetical protein ACJ76H_17270 [Bacteriovoracaceae bacterium]